MDLRASWPYIVEVARQRLAHNKTENHVSDYGEDIEILGAAGELAARRFLGVSELLHTEFDGGIDIVWNGIRIDVKATHLTPKVNNRYLQWFEEKPVKADIVLLTAVHLNLKRAAVIGYATRREVLNAPVNYERDYPCHEISVRQLHPSWELIMPGSEKSLPHLSIPAPSRAGS